MLFSEDSLKKELDNVVENLKDYLSSLRTGRANPAIFEQVEVEYYGQPVELKSVANVIVPNSLTVIIEPYSSDDSEAITEAIQKANIGFNPVNEGDKVRINIPSMTEERRKSIVSEMNLDLENRFKKKVRQIRQDYIQKAERNEDASDEMIRAARKQIQEHIDPTVDKLDELAKSKREELMDMNA